MCDKKMEDIALPFLYSPCFTKQFPGLRLNKHRDFGEISREELPDTLEMKNVASRKGIRIGDGKHGINSSADQLVLCWLKQAVWELALVSTAVHVRPSSSASPEGTIFLFLSPEENCTTLSTIRLKHRSPGEFIVMTKVRLRS